MLSMNEVSLVVKDLSKQTKFYTEVIGLKILEKKDHEVVLGTAKRPLVRLFENPTATIPTDPRTGLYHMAFLLPNDAELGSFIRHIAVNQYEIEGASDHLFSQAMYLHDAEGNGIEVYSDRKEWQKDENGEIKSGNYPIDVEGLLAGANRKWDSISDDAVMGHVHLKVRDLEDVKQFYVEGLEFNVMMNWPQALFISQNGYHHHLGTNTWLKGKEPRHENETGLEYYTMSGIDKSVVEALIDKYPSVLISKEDGVFWLRDFSGIVTKILAN